MTLIEVATAKKRMTRSQLKGKIKNITVAYLFLLPAIVLFFTFDYMPTFSAFYYSFTEYHILAPAKWVGLDNYKAIIKDELFWTGLTNSMKYFFIMVPLLVILPLFLAILANQKLKGIYFFRVIYYLPVITAMVAVSIVWKYLYHPAGLINAIIKFVGLQPDEPINWLLNTKAALPAVSMMEVWKALGFYMVIYLAGLQNLSQDLVEAARMDGATRRRILWHIYLPHLRPIFAVTLILSTLASIQIFTSVYVLTGGGPLNSTISLPVYIYKTAFQQLNMGYGTAMGIILWVILMILTAINFRISRGGKAEA